MLSATLAGKLRGCAGDVVYDEELFTLVIVNKFNCRYVVGRPFTDHTIEFSDHCPIFTDHLPTTYDIRNT